MFGPFRATSPLSGGLLWYVAFPPPIAQPPIPHLLQPVRLTSLPPTLPDLPPCSFIPSLLLPPPPPALPIYSIYLLPLPTLNSQLTPPPPGKSPGGSPARKKRVTANASAPSTPSSPSSTTRWQKPACPQNPSRGGKRRCRARRRWCRRINIRFLIGRRRGIGRVCIVCLFSFLWCRGGEGKKGEGIGIQLAM